MVSAACQGGRPLSTWGLSSISTPRIDVVHHEAADRPCYGVEMLSSEMCAPRAPLGAPDRGMGSRT